MSVVDRFSAAVVTDAEVAAAFVVAVLVDWLSAPEPEQAVKRTRAAALVNAINLVMSFPYPLRVTLTYRGFSGDREISFS